MNSRILAQQFRVLWGLRQAKPKPRPIRAVKVRVSELQRRRLRELASGPGWTSEEWLALQAHYNNHCLACGPTAAIVPDHVIPMKRGGSHSLDNIQPLCNKCNLRKGLQLTDYRPTS